MSVCGSNMKWVSVLGRTKGIVLKNNLHGIKTVTLLPAVNASPCGGDSVALLMHTGTCVSGPGGPSIDGDERIPLGGETPYRRNANPQGERSW